MVFHAGKWPASTHFWMVCGDTPKRSAAWAVVMDFLSMKFRFDVIQLPDDLWLSLLTFWGSSAPKVSFLQQKRHVKAGHSWLAPLLSAKNDLNDLQKE
jgi:hypothetical protein